MCSGLSVLDCEIIFLISRDPLTFDMPAVLKAQDLPDVEIFGRQDPYCSIQIGAQQIRSKVHTGKHPETSAISGLS